MVNRSINSKINNNTVKNLTKSKLSVDGVVDTSFTSMLLDGTSRIELPEAATANDLYDYDGFSVSLWVRNNTTLAANETFFGYRDNSLPLILVRANSSTSKWNFLVRRNGVGSPVTIESSSNIVNEQWIHLVGTWKKSNLAVNFYANGVSQGSATSSGGVGALQSTLTTIGSQDNGTGYLQSASGNIYDVQLFDRELLVSEVTTLYNGRVPGGTAATPLARYLSDETDQTDNDHDGTAVNMSTQLFESFD